MVLTFHFIFVQSLNKHLKTDFPLSSIGQSVSRIQPFLRTNKICHAWWTKIRDKFLFLFRKYTEFKNESLYMYIRVSQSEIRCGITDNIFEFTGYYIKKGYGY